MGLAEKHRHNYAPCMARRKWHIIGRRGQIGVIWTVTVLGGNAAQPLLGVMQHMAR